MKIPRRKFLHLAAGGVALPAISRVAMPRVAMAQGWPSRPVRLLVGFPTGGGADVAGRIVANRLSEMWGQQVVIENKPGAGGNLAIGIAAHANADGYTMVLVPRAITLYGLMLPSLDYDPAADLAPVTLVGTYPNMLAVPNTSPVTSVRAFIAAAKANPGTVTFASPGVGTSPHLSGVLFARMAGIDIRHVPYRGVTTGGMSDLIAGRVELDVQHHRLAAAGRTIRRGARARRHIRRAFRDRAGAADHCRIRRPGLRRDLVVRALCARKDAG